jgi:hypothetical protein
MNNWLITTYECRGDYCYFGDSFCTFLPLHLFAGMLFIALLIGLCLIKFKRNKEVSKNVRAR